MGDARISIRPMEVGESHLIPDYFHQLSDNQLLGMGVDPPKLPSRGDWKQLLREDFDRQHDKRHFFYLLWLVAGAVAGHSNINKIRFGDHAFAHLHLWNAAHRQRGLGTALFRMSVKEYVEQFQLKTIYCEPFAENPAPNRTIPKAGFTFVKRYETLPGWINYHQAVNRWRFSPSQEEC